MTTEIASKATEIPFPRMHLSHTVENGVFEQGVPFRVRYEVDMEEVESPVLMAKQPGGTDAKKGKKEKPKGHTDTATKRK
jgi:hypothetical protein